MVELSNMEQVLKYPECLKCGGTGYVWSLGLPGMCKKCNECGGKGHIGEDLSDKAIEQMMPYRYCEDAYGNIGSMGMGMNK